MNETVAQIGHNLPTVKDKLVANYNRLLDRTDELVAAAGRAPAAIEDDETEGKCGDLVKLIAAAMKNAEAARVAEKEPHLAAGREIDGFFKRMTDALGMAKKTLEQRIGVYLRRKAEEERARREAEEKVKREEAERLAAKALTEADLNRAVEAEREADEAAKRAQARTADLARTRGQDLGSVSTLRTTWDFEIADINAIPLEALRPFIPRAEIEKAIRAFVRAGGRELKGVRIFQSEQAIVR